MRCTMHINDYLKNNPKAVEGLFTKIFGKYMLRYYNNDNYTVEFSMYENTSYQDEAGKRIVIAMNNVISMLNKNINVLAVAYHELAHTLYTNNDTRDKIRKKAIAHVVQESNYNDMSSVVAHKFSSIFTQRLHAIWNVIEDSRIEALLINDFDFLAPIVAPLKTMIDPNGDELFIWRVHGKCNNQVVQHNADSFCLPKKQSQLQLAKYIANIYIELYMQDDIKSVQDYVQNPQDKDRDKTNGDNMQEQALSDDSYYEIMQEQQDFKRIKDNINDTQDDIKERKDMLESDDTSDEEKEYAQKSIAHLRKKILELQEKYDEKYGHGAYAQKLAEQKQDDPSKTLEVIRSLESQSDSDNAVKSMLESIQQTIIENKIEQDYNRAVRDYSIKDTYYIPKIEKVYSAKQKLRQGITAAQSKRYSTNISNKVNVPRIVSSKANRTAPQVFYGRGKDLSFTKKVVIFEDVSSSTMHFTHVFSSIAHSLANSFESVEWYAYGDELFIKQKQHYDKQTRKLGSAANMHIGGTSTYMLTSVMKKYQNKDYTYVIITDGDMRSLYKSDLWSYFKDKCVVMGFIDKQTRDNATYYVDILADIAKRKGYIAKHDDDIKDIMVNARLDSTDFTTKTLYQPSIVKGVHGVIDLIKSRVR